MDPASPGSSPAPAATPVSSTLDAVVEHTIQQGLAEYLKDTEWANSLIDWVHRETGVSKFWITVAIKLFAVLVGKAAAKVATGTAGLGAKVLTWLFERIPGSQKIRVALAKLNREKLALVEFDAVTGGKLSPQNAKFAEHLPRQLRAQLQVNTRLAEIAERVSPQPRIHLWDEPTSDESRFVYTARRVDLLGRDREIALLDEFLSADQRFLWWVIAGPGGIGKSRLALELALLERDAWRIGFMRVFEEFDWSNWQPSEPTALIADYANEKAKELGVIARTLQERVAELAQPVRILLLVREAGGAWASQFMGVGSELSTTQEARYRDPLIVAPLSDNDLWDVLTSFIPVDKPRPPREETLERLKEIDPLRRPLFASFAGDAIARGRDIRRWDQRALVRDILEREEKHWAEAGVTEKDKNLLALATMAVELPTAMISELDPSLFPSNAPTGNDRFDPERYRLMAGAPAEKRLFPLVPDILGEVFVLEHLEPRYDGDDFKPSALRTAAWEANPEGMFSFLSRAVQDFPEHPTLRCLAIPVDSDPIRRFWWAYMVLNFILGYKQVRQVNHSQTLYRALCGLSDEHPLEPGLREERAKSGAALLSIYAESGLFEDALSLYEELRALSEAHSGEATVREQRAKAAFNLLTAYGNAGRVADARALYEELRTMSEAHPGDAAVRRRRAMAAVNLVFDYGNAGQVEDARALYEELRTLSEAHPDEVAVRERRAKAANNLVVAYGDAGQVEDVRVLYEELRTMAEMHPGEDVVREQRAMAAFNLLIDYGRAGQVADARALYEELRAVSEAHPGEAAVRELRAKAATNLIVAYGKAGQVADAQALYEELRTVSEAHQGEAAVREWRAITVTNLIVAYDNAGQLADARALYEELRAVSESHPGEPAVREQHAKAAFNLLVAYGKAGQVADARALYEELRTVSEAHLGEGVVREQRAKAAFNLLIDYDNAGQLADARALYEELRTVSEAHPGEAAVREWRAMAVTNLVAAYGNGGQVEGARALYEELRTLSESHPGDAAVREQRAKAAFNLLIAYGKAGQVRDARALYEELRAIATQYPDEPIVQEAFRRAKELMDTGQTEVPGEGS